MVKLAMMEVLDRLIKSGLSEDDAALLVAALIQELKAEECEDKCLEKSVKAYFNNK